MAKGIGKKTHSARRAPRLASGGAIREAATRLFLERGYQLTSMDEIAAAAGVSKQTIYTHFAGKEELFADLVLANAERVDAFILGLREGMDAPDVRGYLRRLARAYLAFVIRPEVLRLRRLVLGEASRFPDLARTYYERVPERVYLAIAGLFKEMAGQGRLRVADPVVAAHHFVWLTLGLPLDRGMFDVGAAAPPAAELDQLSESAVDVFLSAYAPDR